MLCASWGHIHMSRDSLSSIDWFNEKTTGIWVFYYVLFKNIKIYIYIYIYKYRISFLSYAFLDFPRRFLWFPGGSSPPRRCRRSSSFSKRVPDVPTRWKWGVGWRWACQKQGQKAVSRGHGISRISRNWDLHRHGVQFITVTNYNQSLIRWTHWIEGWFQSNIGGKYNSWIRLTQ